MTAAFLIVDPHYSKFLPIGVNSKGQLDESYYSQSTITLETTTELFGHYSFGEKNMSTGIVIVIVIFIGGRPTRCHATSRVTIYVASRKLPYYEHNIRRRVLILNICNSHSHHWSTINLLPISLFRLFFILDIHIFITNILLILLLLL